jgi:hypothetical protein
LRSRRRASTSGRAAARLRAISGVAPVLALSAMTIRQLSGKVSDRKRWTRAIAAGSAASSL